MGLMLETLSDRLLERGMAHDRAPTRCPRGGSGRSRSAGKLGIPFTTGLLIGIGETARERVDALVAIRDLHESTGTSRRSYPDFRAKRGSDAGRARAIPRRLPDPRRGAARPRADMTSGAAESFAARLSRLLAAGLNDWGGSRPSRSTTSTREKTVAADPRAPARDRGPGPSSCASASRSIRSSLARPEFLDERLRARVAP